MRCRKFQKRLDQLNYAGDHQALPRELLDHLQKCVSCSDFARASVVMTKAVSSEAKGYDQSVMSIEERVSLVASRAGRVQENLLDQLIGFIEKIVWGRGSQAVAISTAAVMIALISLVPFSYDQVVGYNLSLTGICHEVATDDETICDLLLSLGLDQASVDLVECDTSCSMVLFDLRTKAEIELALFAMADLGAEAEISSVDKIINRRTGSLWEQAAERYFTN